MGNAFPVRRVLEKNDAIHAKISRIAWKRFLPTYFTGNALGANLNRGWALFPIAH